MQDRVVHHNEIIHVWLLERSDEFLSCSKSVLIHPLFSGLVECSIAIVIPPAVRSRLLYFADAVSGGILVVLVLLGDIHTNMRHTAILMTLLRLHISAVNLPHLGHLMCSLERQAHLERQAGNR